MRSFATALTIAVLLLTVGFSTQAQTCPTPVIVQTGGSNPSCAGLPVTLDAGGGVSYLWSNGATTRYITDTPAETASYTVTVTDANGCSATSAPLTITVNPTNAATVSTTMPAVCPAGTGQAYVNGPPSGVTWEAYSWSITNGAINGSSTSQTVDYTAGPSGTVTLTAVVTDQNGCESTATTNIPVSVAAPPVIRLDRPTMCPGTSNYAWIDPPAAGSWQYVSWSIQNGQLPAPYPGGPQTSTGFASDPGGQAATITVTAVDSYGCSSTASATVPVRSIPPPVIRLDRP
ncbi:MAG TPA: hypothetical protein VJ276_05420, partial [Thermoanaerobaculia bacterium]|nr:hypothetical protein [Thermoanaerobaculia bacterium]